MGKIMINDINFSGGGPQIDDATTSNSTTWSSNQTNTEITKVAHNSADEYDSTRTSSNKYNKGDLCIYQNTLYKCNADAGTYGPFDSSKWSSTTLSEELDAKQNNIDSIGNMVFNLYGTNTQYYIGDIVEFYGNIYKCIQTPPSAGYSPSGSPTYWGVENLSSQVSDIARCMNIRETFASGTSITSAMESIISKYGKNSLMGGFIITGYGFVHFSFSFSDAGQGGGYVIANNKGSGGNIPAIWSLQYVNGTVTIAY